MSDLETVVKVENVSKTFKLPHEKTTSIKGLVIGLLNYKRSYETQQVLKNINFEIKKGEFLGIIGRNGSGKSTLLKLLAGIYYPNKGTIHINGRLTPFIELGVGFNPELTGRENVYLNGALLGFSRKEMRAMYDSIVEFAELGRFMDQKLKNYSSGMQVRLAFSIAIRAQSDILLIDEVLAVGDALFQQKCYNYFDQLKNSDRTVVFISHDMGAIESFCDRAILIDKSRVITEGNPSEVVRVYSELLAKSEESQKNLPDDGLQHVGVGKAFITGASVIDSKGKVTSRISEGEAFTIRLHYKVEGKIEDPVFGIGIMGQQGQSIIGPNTKEARVKTGNLAKSGFVDASFEENPLSTGTYRVRASIMNTSVTIPYDFVEKLLTFTVIGRKRYGDIHIEPKWAIHNSDNGKK